MRHRLIPVKAAAAFPRSGVRRVSFRAFGAALALAIAIVLMTPLAARATLADNIECAKDTATTINNSFIRDQTSAAQQAVGKMFPIQTTQSNDAFNAQMDAWRTLKAAADANLANAQVHVPEAAVWIART